MQFSVLAQAFYAPDYSYKDKPDDVTDISDELYESLKQATAGGCVVFRDNGKFVISEPRPSQYYEWNSTGNIWEMSAEAKQQQKDDAAAAATQKKSVLRSAADAEISWRQDAVDEGIATDEETAALAEWKKYRVLLMRVDVSKAPDIEWPPQPV
ncbi:tail fiber assembly protein [Citrobacter braakii]|uniref:tail fiber assembly protein n=1 Tax=Citrobacter braakii TaxID=57706 RepID=UPI001F620C72|nr:tail fiber assembly protein [Citrobacter braakii]